MAEKHTTLAQLRLPALRTKLEVLALLVDALEGVQVGMTITRPANSWNGRAQTIQNESFLANDSYYYFICPSDDCRTYGIQAGNVTTDGEMTFQCRTAPETDIAVTILRLEVET